MKLVVIFALFALAIGNSQEKMILNGNSQEKIVESEPYIIEEYGKFTELKHGVSGKVLGVGKKGDMRVLTIDDFNYSGKGM